MTRITIRKMGLFAEPQTIEELNSMIERHCAEERGLMYIASAWTWNYLAEVCNEFFSSSETKGVCPCCHKPLEEDDAEV
jgi:hypothetical protein